MKLVKLMAYLTWALTFLTGPSALPMTDYSQLNHDEPTHWTRAATTHAPSTSGGSWQPIITRFSSSAETVISPEMVTLSPIDEHATQPPPTVLRRPTSVPSGDITSAGSLKQEAHSQSNHSFHELSKTISTKNNNSILVAQQSMKNSVNEADGITEKNLSEWNSKSPTSTRKDSEDYTSAANWPTESTSSSSSYNYDEPDAKQDHYYRYDLVEDLRKQFTNENEISDKQDISDTDIDRVLSSFKKNSDKEEEIGDDGRSVIAQKFDYNAPEGFDSEQEEEEMRREEAGPKSVYDALAIPTLPDVDDSYDADTPFKKWDRDSEEQEKLLENIVFQANNETFDKMEIERSGGVSDEQGEGGRWFLLLLAGNSTIVRLRQKDFAKYLKLNLAARLSLDYDEVKLNKVVLAPPRLMVNVSVVPSALGNLDEEFDLNERLFGEEEAPLHKLAETNATLLELSGEEYHVVRFLSLRSQQPLAMDEVASETSVVITDRHADIECVIYIAIGGACIFLIIPLVVALCKLYLVPLKIKWPWKRDKPLFAGVPWALPRHQRMEELPAPIGGPLTVIYSGSFVERNGPPSGSWIEENYQGSSVLHDEPNLENPGYGFGALDKSTISDICDATVLESPRFNIDSKLRILGCRPNHLLIPHTPVKRSDHKSNLDVRIPKGLDNPNYQT